MDIVYSKDICEGYIRYLQETHQTGSFATAIDYIRTQTDTPDRKEDFVRNVERDLERAEDNGLWNTYSDRNDLNTQCLINAAMFFFMGDRANDENSSVEGSNIEEDSIVEDDVEDYNVGNDEFIIQGAVDRIRRKISTTADIDSLMPIFLEIMYKTSYVDEDGGRYNNFVDGIVSDGTYMDWDDSGRDSVESAFLRGLFKFGTATFRDMLCGDLFDRSADEASEDTHNSMEIEQIEPKRSPVLFEDLAQSTKTTARINKNTHDQSQDTNDKSRQDRDLGKK